MAMITTKNDHHGYAAVKQTLKTISTVKKDFIKRKNVSVNKRRFAIFETGVMAV